MKFLIISILLLVSPSCWAAAFTASVTGNWNSSATWGGAGIPGSGDTATINNGITVTVPSGYTAVIGTSPTDDTGAVALTCSNTASGTGILVVASGGTLKWQGPVRACNSVWTFSAGSHLQYDSSGAGSPTTALYTFQTAQANSPGSSNFLFNGTSGSHVLVDSVGNNPSGGFGITTTRWADGGNATSHYTDFQYQGAPSSSGYAIRSHPSTSGGVMVFDHDTFDHCGAIYTDAGIGAASTFTMNNTVITNPVDPTQTLALDGTIVRTTGTRSITYSIITEGLGFLGVDGQSTGFTFSHNEVKKIFTSSNQMFNLSAGASFDAFDDNLVFANTNSGVSDFFLLPAGTLTNLYLFSHCDRSICANEHPLYNAPGAINTDISAFVIDADYDDYMGDIYETRQDATVSGVTLKFRNGLFLCGATGLAMGSFVNNESGTVQTNLKMYFNHITACAAVGNAGQVYGVGAEGGTTWPVGAVPSLQNDLMFSLTSITNGFIANTPSGFATIAPGAVTVADHNGNWNITGGIYGAPSNQFSTTPGTGDVSGNPGFTDATRNFLAYDHSGLGNPLGTGWVTSHSYAVGDIVSHGATGFFGGTVYNYICIAANTSGSTTEPGNGSAWAETWNPATEADAEAAIIAGTNFATPMIAWVTTGFGFSNVAYHNAGSDGLDIGAGAYVPPAAGTNARMSGNVRISGKAVIQ